jgi:hypothetical protein
MVVAPAVRARAKNAEIVGTGISNWLTAMSPFASGTAVTSSGGHQSVGAGDDHDGVVGIGQRDDRGARMRAVRLAHEAHIHALSDKKCP